MPRKNTQAIILNLQSHLAYLYSSLPFLIQVILSYSVKWDNKQCVKKFFLNAGYLEIPQKVTPAAVGILHAPVLELQCEEHPVEPSVWQDLSKVSRDLKFIQIEPDTEMYSLLYASLFA